MQRISTHNQYDCNRPAQREKTRLVSAETSAQSG